MLEIVCRIDRVEIGAEFGFGQEFRELAAAFGRAEIEMATGLERSDTQTVVGQAVPPDQVDEFTGGGGEVHSIIVPAPF